MKCTFTFAGVAFDDSPFTVGANETLISYPNASAPLSDIRSGLAFDLERWDAFNDAVDAIPTADLLAAWFACVDAFPSDHSFYSDIWEPEEGARQETVQIWFRVSVEG